MPDAVFTRCTGCKAKLKLKSPGAAGKKIRCPKCEHVFVVRLPKAASPAAPVSTTADVGGPNESPSPAPRKNSESADSTPTLVSWENGIGDDKKYHIAHVSSAGITLVLKMKDYKEWVDVVASANGSLDEAAAKLQELPKSVHLGSEDISRATYAENLNQLTVTDQNQKKTKVPEGKEQADIFAAIKQHLGGTESEEEADAWSVMQTPLFVLAVIGVIGGFFIWFTTICEPDYQATGRRSGMKTVLNSVGYAIGPVWMSVAVGSLATIVLGMMIFQLIKRPIRQVLQYSN